MSELKTISLLYPVLSHFKAIRPHAEVDVREAIALVDFHLRIIYTIVIAFSRRPSSVPIKLLPTPGFGSMLAVVRQGAKLTEDVGTPWVRELVQSWSSKVVGAIDQFKIPNKFKSFKSLRDRLSHGHPMPNDQLSVEATRNGINLLVASLESILAQELEETSIVSMDGKLRMLKKKEGAAFEVSPLWLGTESPPEIRIFSHVTADEIHYIGTDGDIWSERSSDEVAKFTKKYIGEKSDSGAELGRFVKDVLADISSYTEDYSKPSHFFGDDKDTGSLYVAWTRSTSDENQSRIDAFRIGPDNRKEWQCRNENWVSYSDFLRQISNWEILARRIGIGLENFSSERTAEEASRLGVVGKALVRGPSHLKESKDNLSGTQGDELFELATRIDESCRRMKPSTSVFFLVGQAGLGKTDLMLSLARDRAKSIAANPTLPLPLYLFVSSTGRTLSSLEDAVNSSLNITKLLSSHSAKALCRNGLLVLLVDGFDELLGSSGYENALGSLEPWFRELGGRGVLVASARSSYYLTQYRRSLAQSTDLNVDHTLLELQPWTKLESENYLTMMGASASVISSIKERDWSVLSVPFFAKAFAAWLERNLGKVNVFPSMFEIVVEQYLEREALKLSDPNAGSLLNAGELRELFSEVAELMQGSKNREIEQHELVYCAQMVVGSSSLEDYRPGLTRRLSSLCGLGVRSDSSGQNQFGFSHEVLFDCFLSLAMQRRMSGVFNQKSILNLLSASKVNSSVFEWLIEKSAGASDALAEKISFVVDDMNSSRVLSANLGTLWEALLNKRHGVPPTQKACGLQMETVSLSSGGWSSLDLSGSAISHVVVPSEGNLSIANADITFLEAKTGEQASRTLKGVDSANIVSALIGDKFGDTPTQVREIFEGLGLVRKVVHQPDDGRHEVAQYYLERLKRRPDIPVILDRDQKTADDPRLSWIGHFDDHQWSAFLDALVTSEVARLETLPTSGRPKVRLSFNTPVTSILDLAHGGVEVSRFWNLL